MVRPVQIKFVWVHCASHPLDLGSLDLRLMVGSTKSPKVALGQLLAFCQSLGTRGQVMASRCEFGRGELRQQLAGAHHKFHTGLCFKRGMVLAIHCSTTSANSFAFVRISVASVSVATKASS